MLDISDSRFSELVTKGITLAELDRRLKPHSWSEEGFLGKDEDLLQLVYDDWKVLDQAGVSHEQIAQALEKAMKIKSLPNPNYRLMYPAIMTGGGQNCPWNCRGVVGNGQHFIIRKDKEEKAMRILGYLDGDFDDREYDGRFNDCVAVFTELHPHLYREHHFFEGKMSPYRTDPKLLIDAFCL